MVLRPLIPTSGYVGPFFTEHLILAIKAEYDGVKIDPSRMMLSYVSRHDSKDICAIPPHISAALISHIALLGKVSQSRRGYSIRTGELRIRLSDRTVTLHFAAALLEEKAVFRLLHKRELTVTSDARVFFEPADIVGASFAQADRHLANQDTQPAIIVLGVALESILAFACSAHGRSISRPGLGPLLQLARTLKILSPAESCEIDKYRALRNAAAHTVVHSSEGELAEMRHFVHSLAHRLCVIR
jgi:hypothetical protein